jgi:hypothetical protein
LTAPKVLVCESGRTSRSDSSSPPSEKAAASPYLSLSLSEVDDGFPASVTPTIAGTEGPDSYQSSRETICA